MAPLSSRRFVMAVSRFPQLSFLSRSPVEAQSPYSSAKRNSDITVQERIQYACQQPILRQRCYELEALLHHMSSKELHSVFPFLLDNIFGYNGHMGWGLHQLATFSCYDDFQALTAFLGPQGAVMHAVYKQQADPYIKFDFPVANLPNQVRENLERGSIPGFYQNKLNRSHTHVHLNAFEYYMFNFAYYIVYPANQKFLNNWASPEEYFYPNLLDEYLCFFLPYDGTNVPPMPAVLSSPTRSPGSGNSPPQYRLPQYGVLYDYLQSGKLDRSPLIRDEASSFYSASSSLFSHHHGTTSDGETWRSEVFVQILVEFWLNQNAISPQNKSLFRQVQDNYMPSLDHVRALRILIKHLHFFANSAPPDPTPYKQSPEPSLDDLKRHIINVLIQKPIYVFLRHGFDHWPLEVTFRQILEVWLSYIQPWRYDADAVLRERHYQRNMIGQRSPMREQRAINMEDQRWRKFISENVPVYTVLFQEFIPRVLRQDLSNAKNALMAYRVAKVFAQLHLAELLEEDENNFLDAFTSGPPKSFSSSTFLSSPSSSHCAASHHQHNLQILGLEGPGFEYKPLFGNAGQFQISQLLQVVAQAKVNLSSLHRIPLVGSLTEDLSNWLNFDTWFWGHSHSPGHAALADDMGPMNTHKAGAYLDQTTGFLVRAFKVDPPDMSDISARQDSYLRRERHLPPDTNEDGQLTDLGRHQMANGYRRFEVEYLGDPDLQPIRTFENAALVRVLYSFCNYVNRKYGEQIQGWYHRPDFLGSVAKQFFHAPAVATRKQRKPSGFVSCRPDHRPRLSLRFLASYQTIGYILAALFLAYLFGFSTTGVIFISLLCVVLYGLVGGTLYHWRWGDGHEWREGEHLTSQ